VGAGEERHGCLGKDQESSDCHGNNPVIPLVKTIRIDSQPLALDINPIHRSLTDEIEKGCIIAAIHMARVARSVGDALLIAGKQNFCAGFTANLEQPKRVSLTQNSPLHIGVNWIKIALDNLVNTSR